MPMMTQNLLLNQFLELHEITYRTTIEIKIDGVNEQNVEKLNGLINLLLNKISLLDDKLNAEVKEKNENYINTKENRIKKIIERKKEAEGLLEQREFDKLILREEANKNIMLLHFIEDRCNHMGWFDRQYQM